MLMLPAWNMPLAGHAVPSASVFPEHHARRQTQATAMARTFICIVAFAMLACVSAAPTGKAVSSYLPLFHCSGLQVKLFQVPVI